ncbi:programmed cell death protein 7-like [Anthonomus grandis grandis]|uniref:programmed cell death protein 7-like n=1 Tax=Anthonomus grandis grandis TaxID=2921223 RepID=UPI002164F7C4|nr:programmed cell death protein 7-like [Anthonomus grandis grandis]XP_050295534.1 programmed cell death protein 7-like [Anthonomus grandis grandis]
MSFLNVHPSFATTSRQAADVASQIFQRQNLNKTQVLDNLYNKSNDELWIESWLQQNNIYRPLPNLKKINVPPNAIKISQAKIYLTKCTGLLEKLNKAQHDLEANVSTLSSNDWKQKTIEIAAIKDEFTKIMCKFDNADVFKHLKVSLRARKKKRANKRRTKDQTMSKKQEEIENKNKLHKEIDQWLYNKRHEVEKLKIEESMQRDADLVLSEVTKKKQDARKQLSLLGALIKLRKVRETTTNQRESITSLENRRAFSLTTEKLIKMWEDTLLVYTKEEHGLKLMLEKNHTEGSKQSKIAKERKLIDEWKTTFFGQMQAVPSNNATYWALTAAERDLETFVAIRKSWDTFMVSQTNEFGSRIPIGWVLPDERAIPSWNKYLESRELNH